MSKEKIGRREVEKVADLSRLEVEKGELEVFASQLNDILEYMDTLTRLDVEGVDPLTHVLDLSNVTHPDQVIPPAAPGTYLANAPRSEDGFFIAPPVIE